MSNSNVKVGDKIRAYDFEPGDNRPERYVEGRVYNINTQYGVYEIVCQKDTLYTKHSRVGLEIQVPIDLLITEWDGRVTVIED